MTAPRLRRLTRRYDLVSFDPRGVGRSAGVNCAAADGESPPGRPARQRRRTRRGPADHRGVRAACAPSTSGKLLPHVGTVNAARDMDRIRPSLGDEALNYFGISYGTQLGGVYAPGTPSVGRFVLDGALEPTCHLAERATVAGGGVPAGRTRPSCRRLRQGARPCEIGAD